MDLDALDETRCVDRMENKPADKKTQEKSYISESLEDLVWLKERRKIQCDFNSRA
jgi:hypothetical protein